MSERKLVPILALVACIVAGGGLTAFATDRGQDGAPLAAADEVVDSALNDKVEATLKTDAGLTGTHIKVVTRSGIVSLAGTVPDEQALRRALETASNVRGVREVRSSVAIDPIVR